MPKLTRPTVRVGCLIIGTVDVELKTGDITNSLTLITTGVSSVIIAIIVI